MNSTSTLSTQYIGANKFLRGVIFVVILYAIGMVTAGNSFAIPLFDLLHFGPNTRGLDPNGVEYAVFTFGVLGAVIIGWMVLLWCITIFALNPNATVRALARHALAISIGVWFVSDTGFSLATGEWEHAAFNIPFVSLLAIPLAIMMSSDGMVTKKE